MDNQAHQQAGKPLPVRRRPLLKQRFEVYVCTAAERGYALEAWRILDPQVGPQGSLILILDRTSNVQLALKLSNMSAQQSALLLTAASACRRS